MRFSLDCPSCEQPIVGRRVTVTTEATGPGGVDVEVTKRWVLCRSCGDAIFARIGEPSPWVDGDSRTLVLPGEAQDGAQLGGYARSPV